jgi:cell division protein FtsN
VFIAPQGDLSIVLVGPYASRAEAEQARNAIVSAGLESNPQIFEFTGETTVQQTSAPSPGPTPTEATPSPTPAPAPTTGNGSLIQVGAYGSSQSAQPQRQRLEALGFSVSELQEGALVKLVIGPFAGDDLAEVRSRLTAQGIDHFVR